MSTPRRLVSVTLSRLSTARARVVLSLKTLARGARPALLAAIRWLMHLWRASLQFRVIVSTMLLGLFVVLLLGSYLYQRIADGLVNERILTARAEATSQAGAAQSRFDSAGRTDTVNLTQLAYDVVAQLSSPGADQSREMILTLS